MRKIFSTFVLAALLLTNSSLFSADLSQFSDKLNNITDAKLQTTLKNSIVAGLIETQEDFDAVVLRAESVANSSSTDYYSASNRAADGSALSQKIASLANPIKKLDKDAIKVVKNEEKGSKKLFQEIQNTLPASYKDTIALCKRFNPKVNTSELKTNGKYIDEYFEKIKKDPCIDYALSVTNTTLEQMKANWFGGGNGFEHVIAGEFKSKSVSGYHWWYKFYVDERDGNAEPVTALAGIGNPRIYTGKFTWDPDGDGPAPKCLKPKGGFSIANSAQSLLALGHIAFETMKQLNNGKVFSALSFTADINGESFTWQMYTLNGSIRSLYPIAATKADKKIYYEFDE